MILVSTMTAVRPARLPEPVQHDNINLDIPLETRIGLYERQQVIRQFEQRAFDLFMENLVKGTSHLSLGMEAVSAGFGQAMRPDDYTFATYRGHAHILSRAAPLGPVMAELIGRENGILNGKGGSMHLTSVKHNMMGSYAIIGAHMVIANGTAWSAQLRGTDQVTAVPHPAADRTAAYGLERIIVDARRGERPSLVEAMTYRHGGHSRADPGKYRPADEVEAWLERDPIPMYHQCLLTLGVPEERLTGIQQDVARRVDEATEFAKAGAHLSKEHLMTDVWADGGSAWRN